MNTIIDVTPEFYRAAVILLLVQSALGYVNRRLMARRIVKELIKALKDKR